MSRFFPCVPWYLAVLGFAAVQAVAAAETFPYQATVATAGAAVRCGPAERYYLTDTLAEGESVEVYQQRPDGWCAIRPPESSFSWVFGRHVEPVGEDLGRINKADVPARVGSRLTRQRNVAQVLLRKDEVVKIVDQESHNGETWYKIAPPAGEFRWMHLSSLRRDAATDEKAEAETAQADAAWRPVAWPNPQPFDTTKASARKGPVDLASSKSSKSSSSPEKTSTTETVSSPPSPAPQPESKLAPAATFDRQLANLELRLSRTVAESPASWNFAQLERDAEQLLSQAQTIGQRDLVKGTLAKIDRFSMIQRRYAQTGGNVGVAMRSSATVPGMAPGGAPAAGQNGVPQTAAGQFDAVGVLRPVVSRRPGGPQYALVDQRGQVVSFVTPTPDVNLQPYLGRQVGVIGARGFMPELRRAHVTASRVSPLGDRLLR